MDWLHAIGDVNGLAYSTHMGAYQARMAANVIVGRAKGTEVNSKAWSKFTHTADFGAVAQVVFTDPNVAFVGLTASEAHKKGLNVKLVEAPFAFPGAWVHAEFNYGGWAQWVIDKDKNVLVGATFVGREAADLLHASTVAIVGEVPVDRLQHAVASFPTVSEIYTALSMAAAQ
jgi:pyruvate/2-oxoglutarate dehydrogenase complex dihydrolipoamide dehydrogenase (E3) component